MILRNMYEGFVFCMGERGRVLGAILSFLSDEPPKRIDLRVSEPGVLSR